MFGFLEKKTHCVGLPRNFGAIPKVVSQMSLSEDQIRVSIAIPGMQKDSLQVEIGACRVAPQIRWVSGCVGLHDSFELAVRAFTLTSPAHRLHM